MMALPTPTRKETPMYVDPNFKSKKAFKEAVAAGKDVYVFSRGPFPAKQNGTEFVEGPHHPQPHTWYAQVVVENGKVVKVK
jgi:hypothetical protein